MKNFTKVLLAASIGLASIGSTGAFAADDPSNLPANNAGFDIRDRLEGVYNNFNSSFTHGSAPTLQSYGELLYVVDNLRDDVTNYDPLTLSFDSEGHIQVSSPTYLTTLGFDMGDVTKSVDKFVGAVTTDLFGSNGDIGQKNAEGSALGVVATDNDGIIGNQLNTAVANVVAYNNAAIGEGDQTTDQAYATFNNDFSGPDGFQVRFNDSVDVLGGVDDTIQGAVDGDFTEFRLYATVVETDAMYQDGVRITASVSTETQGGNQPWGEGATELEAGGSAYAKFISQGQEVDSDGNTTGYRWNAEG